MIGVADVGGIDYIAQEAEGRRVVAEKVASGELKLHAHTGAETKMLALIYKPPGWQRALTKAARRVESGACGRGAVGAFQMPRDRTRADNAARLEAERRGELVDRHRHGVARG